MGKDGQPPINPLMILELISQVQKDTKQRILGQAMGDGLVLGIAITHLHSDKPKRPLQSEQTIISTGTFCRHTAPKITTKTYITRLPVFPSLITRPPTIRSSVPSKFILSYYQ